MEVALHPRPRRFGFVTAVLGYVPVRRLVIVFGCFKVAELGVWIAVTTLAYGFGGVREASLVMAAQLAPAALAARKVDMAACRFGTTRLLRGGLVAQTLAVAAVGMLVVVQAPPVAVYTAAVCAAVAVVTTRPTIATLLPGLLADLHELTAANAVIGWIEGAAILVGPALTALALTAGGQAAPYLLFAAVLAVACLLVPGPPVPTGRGEGNAPASGQAAAPPDPARMPAAVMRRGRRALLGVLASNNFLIGALDVLFVVVAIDLLGGSDSDAAWLNTSFGIGALAGGAASVLLIGRTRLWPCVAVSAVTACAALASLTLLGSMAASSAALAVCGAGSAVLLVGARTLLQRICDDTSLCRSFATAECAEMGMLLAGALAVPVAVAELGARATPLVVAAAACAVAVALTRRVALTEGRVQITALPWQAKTRRGAEAALALREHESPPGGLGVTTYDEALLDDLRRRGRPRVFERGEMLLLEGDLAGHVILIETGYVKVWATTEEGEEVVLAVRGPGEVVGELAALDNRPRSACVMAMDRVEACLVRNAEFEDFLTSHPRALLGMARDLAARLREADETRVALAAHSVEVRVARRLLDLAERHGTDTDAGTAIALPISQADLGNWAGATREAVARVLADFRSCGLVETGRRQIVILDRSGLRARTLY